MLIAAGLAAVAVAVATVNGLMVSSDSRVYVVSAESLREGRGFTDGGEAVILWPVGYPALLAVGGWVMDVFTFATVVNVLGMAAAAWLGALGARRLADGGPREVWGAALVVTSPALFLMALALLSELVFTVMVLATAVELAADRWTWGRILRLGVVLGVLCLVRWAGISVVAGAVLAMWFTPGSPAERLKRAAALGVLGFVPVTVAALRNQAAAGTPFGDRGPGDVGLVEVGRQFVEAIGASLIRHGESAHLMVGVAGTGLLVFVLIRSLAGTDRQRRVSLVALAYFGFVVVSRYRTGFDDLSPRFLLPGLPVVAVAAAGLPGWSKQRAVTMSAVILLGSLVILRAVVAGVVDGPQERSDLFPAGQARAHDGMPSG